MEFDRLFELVKYVGGYGRYCTDSYLRMERFEPGFDGSSLQIKDGVATIYMWQESGHKGDSYGEKTRPATREDIQGLEDKLWNEAVAKRKTEILESQSQKLTNQAVNSLRLKYPPLAGTKPR